MFVRLAFAVAVHADPDILIVDEALSVGDTRFQQRCFERISEIRNRGCTILIVTHALEQVAHFCDRALLLNHGTLLADGETASALSSYLAILNAAPEQKMAPKSATTINDCFSSHPAYNPGENRWGDRAATIADIVITQDGKKNPETIAPGHIVELRLRIDFHADIQRPIYGLAIKSPMGALVLNTNSRYLLGANGTPDQNAGDTVFVTFIFDAFLDCGKYLLSFGIASESTGGVVPHDRRYDAISIEVAHPHSSTGAIALNPRFALTMTP
jgi:lipopolysaccharide transport system ATP-binding protein